MALSMMGKQMERQNQSEMGSPVKHHGSPTKGMMNVLSKPRISQEPRASLNKHTLDKADEIPMTIEDVPFRRQDRRILNSRKKRVILRHMYRCSCIMALFLLMGGSALVTLYILFINDPDWWFVSPFLIIGITLLVFGVFFILVFLDICCRLASNLKRVQDPEVDKVDNLHLIKHWMEPELIPFGWGHQEDPESVHNSGNHGNNKPIIFESDRATLKDDEVYAGKLPNAVLDESNPHIEMAAVMNNPDSTDHDMEMTETSLNISKTIFDESLRYSNVDRPSLSIKPSSPVPQRRGSFEDPNEKIANLFHSNGSAS